MRQASVDAARVALKATEKLLAAQPNHPPPLQRVIVEMTGLMRLRLTLLETWMNEPVHTYSNSLVDTMATDCLDLMEAQVDMLRGILRSELRKSRLS